MTSPTTDPRPGSLVAVRPIAAPGADGRLAGLAVMTGCVLATLHGGPVVLVSDYCLVAALFCFGLRAARPQVADPTH